MTIRAACTFCNAIYEQTEWQMTCPHCRDSNSRGGEKSVYKSSYRGSTKVSLPRLKCLEEEPKEIVKPLVAGNKRPKSQGIEVERGPYKRR
jgi:phage FluMu protein Com